MPDVQKKKLNKGAAIALLFLAAMIGISFLKISIWIKLAADALLILCFIFIRRGYIYLSVGAMNFKKGNLDKAWKNLEKAMKAGLDPESATWSAPRTSSREMLSAACRYLRLWRLTPRQGTTPRWLW
ncbi:MAG: hypothetical protein IKO96_03170 [Spirochaetales bacterium]|nr:hypothetical protein [Spirochaetales bacterium]